MQYSKEEGVLANLDFPFNPNGSNYDIAAVTNTSGKILAMMPHPERAFYHHQPDWQNRNHNSKYCDGYKIFHNAKMYFK